MNTLLHFLTLLLPTVESQPERDEAYLAEAVDLNDLERRIREIDERGRDHTTATILGFEGR